MTGERQDEKVTTDKVKVRATLERGQIDWEVDGKKAKDAKLKLDKDSGAHVITFELDDDTGRNLRFDTGDPIWVDEDRPCPPRQGINSDQVRVTDCSDETLVAFDRNSEHARELRYQLNFIANDGSRETCDPIIDNGGGVGGFD